MVRLSLSRLAAVWFGFGAILAASVPEGHASPETAEAETCLRWAAVAAAEFGVPEPLMSAITRVETARGGAPAWPWAINADGAGHWFASAGEATAFAEQAMAQGITQLDLGCFQLNVRWHGDAFSSLNQMLDPGQNARYAARFLARLHAEFGNWTEAAAAFHSRTPEHGNAYLRRLKATLDEGPPSFADDPLRLAGVARAPRPLLTDIAPLAGLPPQGAHASTLDAPVASTDGRGGLLYVRR